MVGEDSKHGESEQVRTKQAKGGLARAKKLPGQRRSDIARSGGHARWAKERELIAEAVDLPEARYRGYLKLIGVELPCYVLDDGRRVIGRTSANEMLTGIKGYGDLEKTINVRALKPFIQAEKVLEQMVPFRLPEVEGTGNQVKGLEAGALIELCQGFVEALDKTSKPNSLYPQLTDRQKEMAFQASRFLASCAKVGLEALIDEATGYQYARAEDALQVKLRAYLSEEMRQWEKTFPDELWLEFARLTGWAGSVTQRPKYWGKLVLELIYEYLDPDVATWLKKNAPKPRHGQNYHLWLTEQYGLKKLLEHIWMVIGMAKVCQNMTELRDRMAEQFGRVPVQLRFYFPPPKQENGLSK